MADLLSPETSMGGARPKIVVESSGELWLAKFAHKDDRWNHPRNHALVAEGRTWRLSPAYDVMPMPTHATGQWSLAMACGPFGKIASKGNLVAGAGRFLLGEKEAGQIFKQVSGRVRAQWEPTLRQCGVSERDCQAIAPAFRRAGLLDLLENPRGVR